MVVVVVVVVLCVFLRVFFYSFLYVMLITHRAVGVCVCARVNSHDTRVFVCNLACVFLMSLPGLAVDLLPW